KNYKIALENTGIGPAILRSVKVYAKGNTYDDIVFFLDDTFTEADSVAYGHSNLWEGRMIPQGETVYPISVTDNKVSSGLKILEAVFDLYTYIEITYESVYGETWRLTNRNSSPVKVCDTCSVDPRTYGYRSESLEIIPISDHSYMHISYLETDSAGFKGCNGYIYIDDGEAVIFDTPVNNEGAMDLLEWVENSLGASIKAVVASHSHKDGLGGLEAFHQAGIPSYSHTLTVRLAAEHGRTVPLNGFETQQHFQIGETEVISYFLGEGSTQDNIVSYIPKDQLLFGGCLVKSLKADLGNLGESNIQEWPHTLRKIKQKFPAIESIIPGHGMPGGIELLDQTLLLVESEANSTLPE
ncbi:MAG: subclass B1 metallo-beta-lactamase, partial [Bacteroidota bacterium]